MKKKLENYANNSYVNTLTLISTLFNFYIFSINPKNGQLINKKYENKL